VGLPLIVGLTGRAGSGKDTVGGILVRELGYTRLAFADALKSMALAINPIIREYQFPKHPERLVPLVSMLGWEGAKKDGEVRRFLQALGDEGVRKHLGEDAWIAALLKAWAEVGPEDERPVKIVITDVRYPNEAALAQSNGVCWRIVRPGREEIATPEHSSEALVDTLDVDLVIMNNGSLDELKATVLAQAAETFALQ
jgi:hypothetical protein